MSFRTGTRLNFFPTTINDWKNNVSVSSGGERLYHQAGQPDAKLISCDKIRISGNIIEQLATNGNKTWFVSSHVKPHKIQRKSSNALYLQQFALLYEPLME